MMGETRAAKRAGFSQEPRGNDHLGTRADRRDPSASPAEGGLFDHWRAPHPAPGRGSRAKQKGPLLREGCW